MTCICSVHWVTLTGRSRCRVRPLQMLHNLHRGTCSKCAFRWGAACLHICLKRELQGSSSAPEHEIDWTLGHGSGLQQKPKLCGRKEDAFLLLVRILDNACCVVYSCASVLELVGSQTECRGMTVVRPEANQPACDVFMGHLMKRLNPVRSKASIYPSKFPGRGRI